MKVRQVLVPGRAEGLPLVLTKPISLWGGIDPQSGRIIDPRHPQHDTCVTGRILVLERVIGSSSGSSIMLELVMAGRAPAGVILAEPDAILVLGVIVARAMQFGSLPVVLADLEPGLGSTGRNGSPSTWRIQAEGDELTAQIVTS